MLHDGQIREILFDYLDERYGKIRIFEEKNIKKLPRGYYSRDRREYHRHGDKK